MCEAPSARKVEPDEAEYFERLAERMAGLEDRAYDEFAGLFGRYLGSYFRKHGLAASQAEDLTADCITDVALNVSRYRRIEGGGFKAWVFAIAKHALADWWRVNKPIVPLTEDVPSRDPEDQARPNAQVVSAVREAAAKLSDTDRSVIELRDFGEERSYREIADMVGAAERTVIVRHHRALKRLGAMLKDDPRIISFLASRKIGCHRQEQ